MTTVKSVGFENIPIVQKYGYNRSKYFLTGGILLLLYIFYLLQDLFFVNGLNDFDESFIRAEMWVNGEWNWGGGPAKLLSFIEYLVLSPFQDNFMSFYKVMSFIMATLLFIASYLFVVKENSLFPPFIVKLALTVAFLTMPLYIFTNLTIDPTGLFGVMLLFFFVSYRNKYMGWIALLVYLSRPEGIIIAAFYIFFLIFDKKYRKSILINFISAALFIFIYKYIETKFILGSFSITGTQSVDTSFVNTVDNQTGLLLGVLKSLILIPEYLFLYGMEILQNKFLFIVYLTGIIASFFNKKMYPFLVLTMGYAFMYIGLNGFNNPFEFSTAYELLSSKMEWLNKNIEIANGRNRSFNLYGHTRYRIFLYPAIAAFVIHGIYMILKGLYFLVNKNKTVNSGSVLKKKRKGALKKKKAKNVEVKNAKKISLESFGYKQLHTKGIVIFAIISTVVILINLIAYKGFSKPYIYKNQMKDIYMNDYYKLGFEIRKKGKSQSTVFIPGICNCSRPFIAEFLIFSGSKYTLVPVCEGCNEHIVYGHPDIKPGIEAKEIEEKIPSRLVFFDRYAVDYPKTFNDTAVVRINKLYNQFDLSMIDSLDIDFIIYPKELESEYLVPIKKEGDLFLFENTKP